MDKCHNTVCVDPYVDFITQHSILRFICENMSHVYCYVISVSIVLHCMEFQHHSHLCCFQILACTSNSILYTLAAILVHIHKSFSRLYTRSRIAHHRLCSFSILLHTSKLLSKYFLYLHVFPTFESVRLLKFCILVTLKRNPVVFIWIPLITNEIQHHFFCLWSVWNYSIVITVVTHFKN